MNRVNRSESIKIKIKRDRYATTPKEQSNQERRQERGKGDSNRYPSFQVPNISLRRDVKRIALIYKEVTEEGDLSYFIGVFTYLRLDLCAALWPLSRYNVLDLSWSNVVIVVFLSSIHDSLHLCWWNLRSTIVRVQAVDLFAQHRSCFGCKVS